MIKMLIEVLEDGGEQPSYRIVTSPGILKGRVSSLVCGGLIPRVKLPHVR